MYNIQRKKDQNTFSQVLEDINYLKQHLNNVLKESDQTSIQNLIDETEFLLKQAKDDSKTYQERYLILKQLTEQYLTNWRHYKNDLNAMGLIELIDNLTNYSTAYLKLFLALFYINEGNTGQYKDDLQRVVSGYLLLSETIDVFSKYFSISELKQIYDGAKKAILVSDRDIIEYFESELELSNLVTQLRAYSSLIVLKIEEHLDQETNSLDFWESLQQFRQKNNLNEEGIEPEEWLQDLRDHSSGREVNL